MDLGEHTNQWPVGRRSVAVIGPDGLMEKYESDPRETVYPWASVTKVVSALTVLDACLDGTISLEDPVGPPGSTVAHLLSHASGLPFEEGGRLQPPGTRRVYSNLGFEVMGAHLTSAAGGSFADQAQVRVLGPLAMTDAAIEGSPAASGRGSIYDLIALAAELLTPAILGQGIVEKVSTPAFPGLDGLLPGFGRQRPNDWGLGCEIKDHKTPHWTSPDNSAATFGHFGQSGSFVWVDREAKLACVSLCDTDFGPWAALHWPVLSTAVLEHYR